jgi:hypothetical protein
MLQNEAHARIKINQLLEEAGWRFFDNNEGKAKVQSLKPKALTDEGALMGDSKLTVPTVPTVPA